METVNDTDLSSAQLNENIGSPVFDITLVDEFERDIPFSGDIELCLPSLSEDIDVKTTCLGYFDEETSSWDCEDYCLEERNSNQFCGKTSHLTLFALLLDVRKAPSRCGYPQIDPAMKWATVGFGIAGIVAVAVGSVVVEIRIQRRRYHRRAIVRMANALSSLEMSQPQL